MSTLRLASRMMRVQNETHAVRRRASERRIDRKNDVQQPPYADVFVLSLALFFAPSAAIRRMNTDIIRLHFQVEKKMSCSVVKNSATPKVNMGPVPHDTRLKNAQLARLPRK